MIESFQNKYQPQIVVLHAENPTTDKKQKCQEKYKRDWI
jgi:hypothetical protein